MIRLSANNVTGQRGHAFRQTQIDVCFSDPRRKPFASDDLAQRLANVLGS